jgi:CheY-like chemotaxis protein
MIGKIQMRILILEDEKYLAQKISARLQDEGYQTVHCTSIKECDYSAYYNTILLSTNLTGNYEEIIKKYSSSIILLLATYVSEATVTKPINAGASDYILKPFMMDELIRKIKHYEEFNFIKEENKKINNYLDFIFENVPKANKIPKKLPLLIETNEQKIADKIVFQMARKLGKCIKCLSAQDFPKIDTKAYSNLILYIHNLHTTKGAVKKNILKSCETINVILSSNELENVVFDKITIMTDNKISTMDSILTINDYVKQVTLNFQSKYPDTELSRKLGISRKSLWEKRKKFGIEKKKT